MSLHRSEGFGLTIAEGAVGRRADDRDRLQRQRRVRTRRLHYLVDHELCEVPDGLGPYPAGGLWADPDLDHAARLMLHVRANGDEARAMARLGGERLRRTHSLDVAAAFLRARLDQIWKEHPLPSPEQVAAEQAQADPIAAVERYVNDGPTVAGWPARAACVVRCGACCCA